MIKERNFIQIEAASIDVNLRGELILLERLNPCKQEYFEGQFESGRAFVIRYRQTVDVFNFIKCITLMVPLKIVGKPFSVSSMGELGDHASVTQLIQGLKGLNLVLNGDRGLDLPYAYTLSSHEFHNKFETFDHYLRALRSHYRYRVKKAQVKANALRVIKIDQSDFSHDHHDLYLEVYQNSKDKLECLGLDFFREFPSDIYEFRVTKTEEVVGFIQLVREAEKLIFLFGGFKNEHVKTYDLYMDMLIEIIKIGINEGVKTIEFGQTAEETKLKLGCVSVPKYLYVHHSSKVLQYIISKLLPLLSYKPHPITYNVFKD